ncbi:hypothetical protein NDN08_005656 [Rhodosorus marinus]|uniref:Uncharacterized protein n=1 Tax=Rhodosorus marinus TaxID=101924 RepID=A0AAV8V455_9RHOD|nr:hypothetical protein NDN08_005656 [Rhodosorus marinus]
MEPIKYDMSADDWDLPIDADVQVGPQSWLERGLNGGSNSPLLGQNTSYVSGLVEAKEFKGIRPGASPRFVEGVPHARGSREIRIDSLGNPTPAPLSDQGLSVKVTRKKAETSIQKIARASSQAPRNRVLNMACKKGGDVSTLMCKRSWSLQRSKLRSTYRSKASKEARTQSNNIGARDRGGLGLSHLAQSFDIGVGIGRDLQPFDFQQPFEPVDGDLADSPTMLPVHEQTPRSRLVAQEGAETEPSELRSQCLLPAESGEMGARYGSESYFLSPEPQNDLAQAFQPPSMQPFAVGLGSPPAPAYGPLQPHPDVLNITKSSDPQAGEDPKLNDGLHQTKIDKFVRPLAHSKNNRMLKAKGSKENMEITNFFKPAKAKASAAIGNPPTATRPTSSCSHAVKPGVTKMLHRDATRTAKVIADNLLRRGNVFERDIQSTGTSPSLRIGQLA